MTEYQLTSWRDLPSLVVAREGEHVTKSPLSPRFHDALRAVLRDTGCLGEPALKAYS